MYDKGNPTRNAFSDYFFNDTEVGASAFIFAQSTV